VPDEVGPLDPQVAQKRATARGLLGHRERPGQRPSHQGDEAVSARPVTAMANSSTSAAVAMAASLAAGSSRRIMPRPISGAGRLDQS
jgi:hypothetical protein